MSTRHSTQIALLILIAMTVFAFGCTQQRNELNNDIEYCIDGLDRTVSTNQGTGSTDLQRARCSQC